MIQVKCPYCDKAVTLKGNCDEPFESGEGIPCKCKKCKGEFVVFLSIAEEPK